MLHLRSRPLHLVLALLLTASARAAQEADEAGARWGEDYFPDVELVTHEGRRVRFFDDLLSGKVVLLNFIYTRCPDSCPLESAKLAEVQELLGERLGRDVFFYSISIDPAHDTPEALAEYARRFGARPGWLFLRGSAADVELIERKLGVFQSDAESGSLDHTLSFVLGNQATGEWLKRSPFETPQVLASDLGGRLHGWKTGPGQANDYADAPALRSLGTGEQLFRLRCATCHVIGHGDGLPRVGPNLRGVPGQRERAWLERWLAEPDAVLAEKDPLATALFEAWNRVPMPNLRLSATEVGAILDFMEEEDARVARLESAVAEVAERPGAPAACCRKREEGVLRAENAENAQNEATAADPRAVAFVLSLTARYSLAAGLLLGLVAWLEARRAGRARAALS